MKTTMTVAAVVLSLFLGASLVGADGSSHDIVVARPIAETETQDADAVFSALNETTAAQMRGAVKSDGRRMMTLLGTHRGAGDDASRRAALRELVTTAAARQQRLAALVEERPEDVIAAAMSPADRAALPAEVQGYVEEHVTIEGELDVLHEDNDAGGRYVHWLRAGGSRLSVHFAGRAPELETGDRVRVRALRVRTALAVAGDTGGTVLLSAAPVANTFGAQNSIVIIIAYQDKPTVTSSTVAEARQTMFGATYSVSSHLLESSYGQTSATGNAFGPYVIANKSTSCNYWSIAQAADQAAVAAGVNLTSYRRRVYAMPYTSTCGWGGLGTVGGSPSQAWINGGSAGYGGMPLGLVAHEFGHNLGLYHSKALDCGTAAFGGSCTSLEYGDAVDMMGSGGMSQFNAAQKERLGWLGWQQSPPLTTVAATGAYTIEPYETMGTEPKALKIPAGNGDAFYVEYRIKGDSYPNLSKGVVVHFMDASNPNAIYLLDMTPATSSWRDPALAVGQSFTDTVSKVTISPIWVNGAAAGVNVTLGGSVACVRQAPTVTVSPAQQQGAAGTQIAYAVAVKNNDTGCATATFRQQATAPAGWGATFATATMAIASGATQSTTLAITSLATAADGAYMVSGTATNDALAAYTGSATATYSVATSGGGGGDFSDGFNRANSTIVGNGWVEASGDLAIQEGQLRNATTKALHLAVVPGVTGPTQSVGAEFTAADAAGTTFGVIVRYKDPANYYICYRQTGGTSRLKIARVKGGVMALLGAASVANPAKGSTFTLTCAVQGSTLTLGFNGATKVTKSDPTFATGSVGVAINTKAGKTVAAVHGIDQFTATAR